MHTHNKQLYLWHFCDNWSQFNYKAIYDLIIQSRLEEVILLDDTDVAQEICLIHPSSALFAVIYF